MQEQRRRQPQDRDSQNEQDLERTGPRLEDLREEAQDFLRQGDDIITQALSENSEQFVNQTRQQGGQ